MGTDPKQPDKSDQQKRKEQTAAEGKEAMSDYKEARRAADANMARLKALRLAKEAEPAKAPAKKKK